MLLFTSLGKTKQRQRKNKLHPDDYSLKYTKHDTQSSGLHYTAYLKPWCSLKDPKIYCISDLAWHCSWNALPVGPICDLWIDTATYLIDCYHDDGQWDLKRWQRGDPRRQRHCWKYKHCETSVFHSWDSSFHSTWMGSYWDGAFSLGSGKGRITGIDKYIISAKLNYLLLTLLFYSFFDPPTWEVYFLSVAVDLLLLVIVRL